MSREDQPVDRTFGDYQDEAGMLPAPPALQDGDQSAPLTLPGAATQPDAPTEPLPTNAAFPFPAEGHPDAMGGVDPFVLWAATSGKPLTSPPAPEPSTRRPSMRRAKSDPGSCPRPAQQDRRKFVKLLAVSAAGLVTVVTVGGISFARAPQSATQTPARIEEENGRIRSRLSSPRRDPRRPQRNRRDPRRPRRLR